jgi:hypothetical protein
MSGDTVSKSSTRRSREDPVTSLQRFLPGRFVPLVAATFGIRD